MGNVQILRIKNYKYSNIQRSVVERGKIVEKGRMSVNVCDCTFLRNVRRNIFLIGLTTRARRWIR